VFIEVEGRKIEQMGLEAVPQVGVAGFYVDIGVRRREGDRSFLLDIRASRILSCCFAISFGSTL
jgi:hypothetical protein